MAGTWRLANGMDKRAASRSAALGICRYAMATSAGDRVDVAAMDAVCAGSAVYSRPVRFTSAARHRLPVRWPLLVVEQLKRQLTIVHEAQRARGVPLDEGWYQRLRAMPALIVPLTQNALNDLTIRGAALDMRGFRLHRARTTLWAPKDSVLQRVARYGMVLLILAEAGVWIWLR